MMFPVKSKFNQSLSFEYIIYSTMKTNSKLFLGAILAIVALVSVSSLNPSTEAIAQVTENGPQEKTISVTGTASTSVEPDLLVVTFGMETQEKTAKEALDANSDAMNRVISAINIAGIKQDQISTSGFNIFPVYDGFEDPVTKRWTQELRGYQVTNTITVKTGKLDLAASIIDGAVTAGANRVDNVYFTISPDRQVILKDDLIGRAVENAKEKAEKALTPLEYTIVGVKAVSLSDFAMPSPMPMYNMAFDSMAGKSAPTPIFSADQDINTSASVVFLIGSK